MKSLVALIKREFIEHKGAFFYAPGALVLLLALILLSGIGFGRFTSYTQIGVISGSKGFELVFLALSALWMAYLLIALFFYFADAFSADNRNNSMLFWKSMPLSDFKMLASKMLAGLTIFPAVIVAALLLSALIVFASVFAMLATTSGSMPLRPADFLASAGNILAYDLGYLVLALLWYSPFFAWVGLLSAMFRRWSIPLAFLIPGLIGLAENLLFRNLLAAPNAGYVLDYLHHRMTLAVDGDDVWASLVRGGSFDAGSLFARLLSTTDWPQLVGGLIVAALFVYLASEVRRRAVAG